MSLYVERRILTAEVIPLRPLITELASNTMVAPSSVGKEFVNAATTLHTLSTASSTYSSRVPAHSSIAKTLTHFLFSEVELPSILSGDYGNLIKAFTSGVTAGSSLWYFFRRNQARRDRIQFAMFHLIRLCENMSPEDSQRFRENPNLAIAAMQEEVLHMTTSQITPEEGEATINQYKRKVWGEFDAEMVERSVRRRVGATAVANLDIARQNTSKISSLRAKIRDATTKGLPGNQGTSRPHRPQAGSRLTREQKVENPNNDPAVRTPLQHNTPRNGSLHIPDSAPSSGNSNGAYSSSPSGDGIPPLPPHVYASVQKAPKTGSARPTSRGETIVGPRVPVVKQSFVTKTETTRGGPRPANPVVEDDVSAGTSDTHPKNREMTEIIEEQTMRIAQLQREIDRSKMEVKNIAHTQSQPNDTTDTETTPSGIRRPGKPHVPKTTSAPTAHPLSPSGPSIPANSPPSPSRQPSPISAPPKKAPTPATHSDGGSSLSPAPSSPNLVKPSDTTTHPAPATSPPPHKPVRKTPGSSKKPASTPGTRRSTRIQALNKKKK